MQSRRSMLVLTAATLVMSGAAIGFSLTAGHNQTVQSGGLAFPDLANQLNAIDRVQISSGEASFELLRTEAGWIAADKDGFPANTAVLTESLIGLSRLTLEEPRTADPSLYARLEVQDPGKDAPSVRIVLQSGGQVAADLIVGKMRLAGLGGGKEARYVRKGNEAQAWLAGGSLKVEKEAVRWLRRSIINISRDRIGETRLEGPDRATLVINRPDAQTADFTIANLPADRKVEQSWRVNNIAAALETLEFDDVRADSESAQRVGTARFVGFDGISVTATLVMLDDRNWLRITAEAAADAADPIKDEARDLASQTEGWLFRIPGYREERFTATVDSITSPAGAS